jgi:hypothetical protein
MLIRFLIFGKRYCGWRARFQSGSRIVHLHAVLQGFAIEKSQTFRTKLYSMGKDSIF